MLSDQVCRLCTRAYLLRAQKISAMLVGIISYPYHLLSGTQTSYISLSMLCMRPTSYPQHVDRSFNSQETTHNILSKKVHMSEADERDTINKYTLSFALISASTRERPIWLWRRSVTSQANAVRDRRTSRFLIRLVS